MCDSVILGDGRVVCMATGTVLPTKVNLRKVDQLEPQTTKPLDNLFTTLFRLKTMAQRSLSVVDTQWPTVRKVTLSETLQDEVDADAC